MAGRKVSTNLATNLSTKFCQLITTLSFSMSRQLVYMFGKLAKAVEVLVTSPYDVRERVWVASTYLFMLVPDALPESCRDDVAWIHKMLTSYPALARALQPER